VVKWVGGLTQLIKNEAGGRGDAPKAGALMDGLDV